MVDNGYDPLPSHPRVRKDICLGGRLVLRQGGKRGGEGRGDSFVVLTGGLGRINILAEVEMSRDEDGDRVQEAAGGGVVLQVRC